MPAPQVRVFSRLSHGDTLGSINAHRGHTSATLGCANRSREYNGVINPDTRKNSALSVSDTMSELKHTGHGSKLGTMKAAVIP